MSLLKEALTFATGILILVAFIVPMVGLAVGEPLVNPPLLTADGADLPQSAPFASSLVATSSTVWDVVMNFDEDISTPAVVADGTPSFDFTNGTLQVVSDCGDANAKTYCFTYVPPSGIEAAVFWFFRISGAANATEDYMATTTYRFIVDTAGPILSFTNVISAQLPTVEGTASFSSTVVNITISNALLSRTYQTTAVGGFWSLILQPGDELPPGTYSIVAIGIDQYKNIGAPIVTSITVPAPPPPLPPSGPTDKDQCKKNGWKTFTNPSFKNQGDCVSFVEKNKEKKNEEKRKEKEQENRGGRNDRDSDR